MHLIDAQLALEPVAENLFVAEGPVVDFHGFPYPTRMVVARLAGGELWVWSPIALGESLRREVEQLGPVAHLVSPNKIHHLFLGEWKEAFVEARLWGLPSVVNKRDDLSFAGELGDEPPDAWRGEIDQVVFRGSPFMDEIVFFHRASRTAVFADLIENFDDGFIREHWKGWKGRLAKYWGITEPYGQAPLEWRVSFIRKKRARAALGTVLRWEPERVIMAHGVCVDRGAVHFLEKSFRWLR